MPRNRRSPAATQRRGASKLEWWPVDRLVPYERNPRKHPEAQVVALMALITEVGFNAPILVDGEAGIIAGHGRLIAARRLGMAEVPVVELTHMTAEQKRMQIVADNKLAAMAGWDPQLLADELREIADDGLLELTGFSDEDLQRLQDDLDQHDIQTLAGAATPAEAANDNAPAPASPAEASSSSSSQSGEAPTAGAPPREEQLPFSVVMDADDRARLFEALAVAKRKWNLTTSAQALLAMANDFIARETP